VAHFAGRLQREAVALPSRKHCGVDYEQRFVQLYRDQDGHRMEAMASAQAIP
jgi:hypothetical protein